MTRRPPSRPQTPAEAEERRRSTRLHWSEQPPLSVDGLVCYVHDISREGMCLITEAELEIGTPRAFTLRDHLSHETCQVVGEPMWREGRRTGIQFTQLTAVQDAWLRVRFLEWLKELSPRPDE